MKAIAPALRRTRHHDFVDVALPRFLESCLDDAYPLPARILLTVARDAFAGVGHCTLQFIVRTTEAGNVDPVPDNDTIGVGLDVRKP